jgi:hypothetical protein
LESFLVLRNGGDLLHELQQQKFDLVLHGHKHRPQFARIELRVDDPEGYPLMVLAAGSTSKKDEDTSDNTLRLIKTEPNGRLIVETLEAGEPLTKEPYREPLSVLKRRAFSRAVERAGLAVAGPQGRAFARATFQVRRFRSQQFRVGAGWGCPGGC